MSKNIGWGDFLEIRKGAADEEEFFSEDGNDNIGVIAKLRDGRWAVCFADEGGKVVDTLEEAHKVAVKIAWDIAKNWVHEFGENVKPNLLYEDEEAIDEDEFIFRILETLWSGGGYFPELKELVQKYIQKEE